MTFESEERDPAGAEEQVSSAAEETEPSERESDTGEGSGEQPPELAAAGAEGEATGGESAAEVSPEQGQTEPGDDAPAPETAPPAQDAPAAETAPPAEAGPVTEDGAPTEDAPPAEDARGADGAGETAAQDAEQPAAAPRSILDMSADARYIATGKRKTSVARVILKPGNGAFDLNGRSLDRYFPRRTLQEVVRQPLAVTSLVDRVDIRARIHGGGVSSQADALRHGIAKALIEADPSLRGELKRRQLLTRDPRVKERRKAGLKKARKRPQFSKR